MRVLIVESDAALARIWRRHLERHGAEVHAAASDAEAIDQLDEETFDIIVLNLVLGNGSAFAVADVAQYRHPGTRVVFVTNTTFFSDGSIFRYIPNACAFLPTATSPEDLAAVVDYYGVSQ